MLRSAPSSKHQRSWLPGLNGKNTFDFITSHYTKLRSGCTVCTLPRDKLGFLVLWTLAALSTASVLGLSLSQYVSDGAILVLVCWGHVPQVNFPHDFSPFVYSSPFFGAQAWIRGPVCVSVGCSPKNMLSINEQTLKNFICGASQVRTNSCSNSHVKTV